MQYLKRITIIYKCFNLILLGYPIAAHSQAEETKKFSDNFGVSLILCYGNQYINAKQLNEAISTAELPGFANYNYFMGLSVELSFKKRIFIESEGSYISNWKIPKNSIKQLEATLTGTRLITSIGYNIVRNNKFFLYTMMGLGGNFITLNVTNTGATNYSFINAINEKNETKFNLLDQLLVSIVGFDYHFTPKHFKCTDQNLRIGIRIGYQYSIPNSWNYGNSNIDGPVFSARGPIVSLIFGSYRQ